MIDKLICIYLDLQKVSKEVENIINVTHYGDILFKKRKLRTYHQELYQKADIPLFYHVTSPEHLAEILEEIRLNKKLYVILHHSCFAITVPSDFQLFLQKIKYLDSTLAISDYDKQKPFVMLDAPAAIGLLEKISRSPELTQFILEEEAEVAELFRLEHFYSTISTGVDFIGFLHTNFEARYFNQIQQDKLFITKKSDTIKKIENEFKYYDFLPDFLKVFFLRPFQLEKTTEWCSYKLEKLNVPDVSIQWIHGAFTEYEFRILTERLFYFVTARPQKELTEAQAKIAIDTFYLRKVTDRIEDLKKMPEYRSIADIISNSTRFESIDAIFNWYKSELERILKKTGYKSVAALSHGDLCGSNMLYDKRINLLKLIDPRGSETADGLYFDACYDVCKLSHSFLGDYDLINNGLFELKYDNNLQIRFVADAIPGKDNLQKLFIKQLELNGFQYEVVRVFEASLFLSMLPLHIDNPKKVVAFILNAVQILEKLSAK